MWQSMLDFPNHYGQLINGVNHVENNLDTFQKDVENLDRKDNVNSAMHQKHMTLDEKWRNNTLFFDSVSGGDITSGCT